MILAAHQPAYLPWLGYFDRIRRSDVFVFLDSVQFEKNSFINRNLIKTPQGAQWLTIPVQTQGHMDGDLRNTLIDNRQPWRTKHLKSIATNYRKAPLFEQNYAKLELLYSREFDLLSDLCFDQLVFWLAELNIEKKIIRAKDLPGLRKKSELVLDLCLLQNADQYLSGPQGRDYLKEEEFKLHNIEITYQKFIPSIYPQLYGEFTQGLSVLDWWMNTTEINWE